MLADPELRSPALKGPAAYDEPQTPAAILDHYGEFSLGEKRDALNTLVSRASFAKALLDGIRRQVLPARDLTADVVRQLRQFKDEEMNKAVETLWGMTREQGADMLQLHARYKALMEKGPRVSYGVVAGRHSNLC